MNFLRNISIIYILILQLACHKKVQETSTQSKINGLSFVASRDSVKEQHITPVKNVNANFIALMPFGFIRELNNPNVIYSNNRQWFGETIDGITQYTQEARKANLKIMLKPQIWVWNGHYTGKIQMDSEANWKTIEDSYRTFIIDFAKLAEKLNLEIFCIGTELELFVKNRPTYWSNLIKEIKTVYSGKLTYAANWDEYKRVPFWSAVDYIGVDAYFPVSDKEAPTVADFQAGWKQHKTEIKTVQQEYKKPILFTEFGYRSVNFAGKEPWKADRITGNVNLQAQKNGLQALYNEFWKEKWFAGGFVWKWFIQHDQVGGTDNNRFTPQNKPAEELLKELYAK